MPLTPQTLLENKYRIESALGQGAFGRVYLARDIHLNRLVAVKELHKGEGDVGSVMFEDFARRFQREARIQAHYNHPHIVHVYELLTPELDRLYLVMEYADGGSLKEWLERKGALSIAEAVRITAEVAAGLAVVHADERDVVHRDVKPSNVLLTKAGTAKLSDFGLAQVGDESMRSQGGQGHPGTAMYMSPEQESSNAYLYPASDVFSLGCVLFEALTGAVYKQAKRRKQGLAELRPETPEWLAELLGRMLEKDPEARPEAGEIRDQLSVNSDQLSVGSGQWTVGSDRKPVTSNQSPAVSNLKEALAAAAQIGEWEEAERLIGELDAAAPDDSTVRVYRGRVEREMAPIRARREAEEKARRDAEDVARREAAEKAQREADEKERLRRELLVELAQGVSMEFVRVPAGDFLMGSADSDTEASRNEKPQHTVYLEAYWIDRTEVTFTQFQDFMNQAGYAASPCGEGERPAACVDWNDAAAYCKWAGRQLPSEAQWEKAARGTDGRIYAWGNAAPDSTLANYRNFIYHTTNVGSYPASASPYGAYDMAGNVWEWVADWYDETYYASSHSNNPTGPLTGDHHVQRGGSFYGVARYVRAAYRGGYYPVFRVDDLGFRCSR